MLPYDAEFIPELVYIRSLEGVLLDIISVIAKEAGFGIHGCAWLVG